MKLIIPTLTPVLLGVVSDIVTRPGIDGWYALANMPWFNPPNWIFAPDEQRFTV